VIVAAIAVMIVLSRLRATRHVYERIMIRLPLVGRIYHLSLLSRLADAMATLVTSGSDMPSCLRLGAAATGSELFKWQCEAVAAGIESGQDLLTASESCGSIPGMFFYSMQQGAQRNELPDNLLGLSEMYARQAVASQSKLQAVLLPSVLLVIGIVIGSAIYSVFAPIIDMIRAFQEF
jgi:type IV pilus assembly protein PilC